MDQDMDINFQEAYKRHFPNGFQSDESSDECDSDFNNYEEYRPNSLLSTSKDTVLHHFPETINSLHTIVNNISSNVSTEYVTDTKKRKKVKQNNIEDKGIRSNSYSLLCTEREFETIEEDFDKINLELDKFNENKPVIKSVPMKCDKIVNGKVIGKKIRAGNGTTKNDRKLITEKINKKKKEEIIGTKPEIHEQTKTVLKKSKGQNNREEKKTKTPVPNNEQHKHTGSNEDKTTKQKKNVEINKQNHGQAESAPNGSKGEKHSQGKETNEDKTAKQKKNDERNKQNKNAQGNKTNEDKTAKQIKNVENNKQNPGQAESATNGLKGEIISQRMKTNEDKTAKQKKNDERYKQNPCQAKSGMNDSKGETTNPQGMKTKTVANKNKQEAANISKKNKEVKTDTIPQTKEGVNGTKKRKNIAKCDAQNIKHESIKDSVKSDAQDIKQDEVEEATKQNILYVVETKRISFERKYCYKEPASNRDIDKYTVFISKSVLRDLLMFSWFFEFLEIETMIN